MKKIFNFLFVPSDDIPLLASADVRRQKVLNFMLVTMSATVICLLAILFILYVVMPGEIHDEDLISISTGCLIALAGFALVAYLNRRISSRKSGMMLLLVSYVVIISADTPYEIVYGRSLIFAAVPVILAAILFPPRGGIIVAFINSAIISCVAIAYYGLPNFPAIWVLFFTALLLWRSTSLLESALEQVKVSNQSLLEAEEQVRLINAELEQRVATRTAELQAANDQLQTEMIERKQAQEDLDAAKESLRLANLGLQQALSREQRVSRTDSLTNTHNRRYFFEIATHEFVTAKRYKKSLSVIIFDIDHFKQFNDRYGHQTGDEVLKRVSQIAQSQLRDADILARYGGEEFAILLPNSTARESAVVAERIRESLATYQLDVSGNMVSVTISAGVAEYTASIDTLDRLIQQADNALYAAKDTGRNRVEIHST